MTLNGEKQVLRMNRGNSEQTECLDNAEAYVPSDDLNVDLGSILYTPLVLYCTSWGLTVNICDLCLGI